MISHTKKVEKKKVGTIAAKDVAGSTLSDEKR